MTSNQQQGRVAVVTGAAGGLGLRFVERLAQDGCDVVVTDVVDLAKAVVNVEAAGRRALALPCDLRDPAAIEEFARKAIGHFGRVDILVNNAAIIDLAPFEQLTNDALRQMLVVNVEAAFHLAKALGPNMREHGWGRIVNMSSGSAWLPSPPMLGYVVSKMALVGLTRGLAATFADQGVTVNAIAPGLIRTPGTEVMPQAFWDEAIGTQLIHRAGMPEDIAGVLSFLCSDDAGFITGQTIHAGGGAVL